MGEFILMNNRKDFDWLNENSRLFLSRGYLPEGQSPEKRLRVISDRAEEILGIEGFSDKFYGYLGKGYYSLSSPVWSNFATERGLPISCVTGDTWVNTDKGGKQAKDIEVGDLVLTHKNRFRPVTDVIPTKDRGDIWKLKVGTRMTNLYITGDHVVLTNTGWKRVDELDINKDLIAVNGQIEYEEQGFVIDMKKFVDYEYIIEDGLIKKAVTNKNKLKALRNNLEETHVTYYAQYPEFVTVDEDLAWAIGLWFADGSVTINNKEEPNGIRLTGNINDRDGIVKRWSEIIADKFNVNTGEYVADTVRNGKENKWVSVSANGKVLGNLFKSFGEGAKYKKLPEEMLNLSKASLTELLGGILAGDGSIRDNGDTIKLTLSNPELLLQVYNIGLKLGKSMSLQMQEKASKLSTTRFVYTLLFREYVNSASRNNVRSGIPFSDGLIYAPIATLGQTDKVEDVYDFTVEEDHSFSVAGVVVHNCFGSHISDDIGSILHTASEVGTMSKLGGGTSGYFGELRGRGVPIRDNGKSSGAVHFVKLFEQITDIISQGGVRRGRFSPYLPIDHPDIEEFLEIGKEGNDIQDVNHAVTVTDSWMIQMIGGDRDKRAIWAKVLQSRVEMGYPYIFFTDTVNNSKPEWYKDYPITHSNLCSEIALPDNERWSFVCNLSSMNALYFDEWKDTDAVETMIFFLDAVMTEFIEKLEAYRDSESLDKQQIFTFMEKAYTFAVENRALGLGVN